MTNARSIFLGLGSNLGDRETNIHEAIRRIEAFCTRLQCSSLYETLPRYIKNHPRFLNCVVRCKTFEEPRDLLTILQQIEVDLGRVRARMGEKGPRVIDIDILLYDSLVRLTTELTLPHPGIQG